MEKEEKRVRTVNLKPYVGEILAMEIGALFDSVVQFLYMGP